MSYDIYTGLLKVFPLPAEADAKADTVFEYNHPKLMN
jgi:hypothetical protein